MEYSYLLPIGPVIPCGPLGIHGLFHWARVLENGLRLAEETGANRRVLELFAWFHDSGRVNDATDVDHGARGADFARRVCGQRGILSPAERETLYEACSNHSHGVSSADLTIRTCWDADRLDVARTGVLPDRKLLCTTTAKSPATIKWTLKEPKRKDAAHP